jgi:surface antigen
MTPFKTATASISPGYPARSRRQPRVATAGFGWGGPVSGGNLYTYGYCTWYVANKVAVPSNWGNANTWDNRAALSGWVVSPIPRAGAVAQTDRGSEGHVAYVEAVSEDGTMIKYSDMNGLAGWGRVGYSDWVPASQVRTLYLPVACRVSAQSSGAATPWLKCSCLGARGARYN